MNLRKAFLVLITVLISLSLWAMPFVQQKGTQKEQPKKEKPADKPAAKDDAPAPIMKSNIGLKSSRRTNDSATAGFNGIDPQGKVAKEALDATPTNLDEVNALALVVYNPHPEELSKFLQEGGLKAAAKSPGKK
ncbi:MAG TPA: hypothetical protein VM056_05120 [Terriglobales bacterium]|nr:hypothetical protein [Terriglobales bacterium]